MLVEGQGLQPSRPWADPDASPALCCVWLPSHLGTFVSTSVTQGQESPPPCIT